MIKLRSFVWVVLMTVVYPLQAAERDDLYLQGYIGAILERELGWVRSDFDVQVQRGLVTLHLYRGDDAKQREAERVLRDLPGMEGLNIARSPAAPSQAEVTVAETLGVGPESVALPAGDPFWPLIADPKEPRFFVSVRRYTTRADTVNIAAVGYGESFGLYRKEGIRRGDALQVSVAGGLLAQFNLDAPSFDLINADYMIGLPITYRRGDFSMRLRLYHQSSHLGDEFLLNTNPDRVNLSYEALEAVFSYDWNQWRGYAGGEYLVHREPADLEPAMLHLGAEYRGVKPVLGSGRWIGGLDMKSYEEHDWSVSTSLKVGWEFGKGGPGRRNLRWLWEAYNGFSPHGQFYNNRLRYFGTGIYLGF
ncbi:MAG: DUF1207 domain-containing protein [Proteobacteria bacterium]|nr:MAG: DUF1207 domain-containing protein [Pseudomonadota bacterium]QKK11595.1 MAG: DUF1207 domain-containing protein [Pseudomonadota bacterium]